jgi:integrase
MDAEAKLVAEQILASPSRFVFTTPRAGTPWRRTNFYDDVLAPARELARETWREENDLAEDAPTPFDRIDNHRLRHTAITLMLRAGLKVELVAQRVGHDDGGALILRTYRHVRNEELRRSLDELGPSLLEALAR